MKYPQLVSMPSAVQDWLDEQLEARGIDAVVYTRYILSLLQRDTLDLPDDLLSLSSNKNKKCGIEKLVDDLCTKLKEIQSEGESTVNIPVTTSQPPPQSPQDQAHKYYAAFPPLNSKSTETSASIITLIPNHSSVWTGKKVLTDSFCKKIEGGSFSNIQHNKTKETAQNNMKCRSQLLNIGRNEKELGYGFAWNMASERNELFSEFCPVSFSNSSSSDLLRVFKYNKQNLGDEEIMKTGVCRRLYERQSEDDAVAVENIGDVFEEDRIHSSDDKEQSPKQGLDDSNLAQLIAKFDHSIEAIWNPEDSPQSPGTIVNGVAVPLEFQQLLSSPNEHLLAVELCSLNNKQNSENNSFIQCGTNITSSIWSDHPSKDNSVEQEDYGMEYALGDQHALCGKYEKIPEKELENTFPEKFIAKGKFQVVHTDDEKFVGDDNLKASNVVGTRSGEKESNILFKNEKANFIVNRSAESKTKISWEKLENFPSFLTSVSWRSINYSMGGLSHTVCNQKWSDLEHSHTNIFTSSCFYPHKPAHHFRSLMEGVENYSFNALNHNKEDSSFTEVIPKNALELNVLQANDVAQNSMQEIDSIGDECEKKTDADVEKDEEDLLTSNRTHFRPIRQESLESHNTAGCYADGTTFAIPNNLEEVSFKRSESGALYLENDVGIETPKKYMEYKEKEPYGGRHRCSDNSPASTIYFHKESNFVPKFRVKQTEKCCQTEEAEEMFTSDEEIDPKRSRHDEMGESGTSDFYFPGDDQFAEKIINCLEDDLNKYVEPCLTCCHREKKYGTAITFASCANHRAQSGIKDHCLTSCGNPEIEIQSWSSAMKTCCNCNNNNLLAWKNGWLKSSNPGLPSEKNGWETSDNVKANDLSQSWYDIWRGSPGPRPVLCPDCCGSPGHAGVDSGKSLQYCRLRKELSEDGEQLLSDLSYLQHLYLGSDWLDDQGEHALLPPQKLQCLSPAGESSQELQFYDEESSCSRSLPVHLIEFRALNEELSEVETKSVDNFISSSSAVPKKFVLSTGPEAEHKLNERTFNARTPQKDRKRRHSASQRTCSFLLEGSCERPHCHVSHDLATVPCQFWADSSCLKGVACPLFHGCVRAFRPVTL
ncbi:uncharacterized protein [Anabrus simplex]|uniref:uncharacterized protein isoform X2 n=1 Tax=Anabrus simplex TaxID=316456 RepID=UPI0035A36C51